MISYEELLARLRASADENYRLFHKKLLKNDKINVIGVRMPVLRKLAREFRGEERLFCFPDEYYEVTFLKCAVAGALPYGEFVRHVDYLVGLLDNWATCDGFQAKCIRNNRGNFLPYIEKYLADGREFVVRFGLVTLLRDYVEREYLPAVFKALKGVWDAPYYVMMGAAWLLAEVLVKFYPEGREFLHSGELSPEVCNKAIQKARESFRLSKEQKAELLGDKR